MSALFCNIIKIRKLFFKAVLVFIWVLIFNNNCLSQIGKNSIIYDTVFINRGSKIVIGTNSITAYSDTIVLIPQNTFFKVRKDADYKSLLFYDSLKQKASRNKFVNELYNLLITRNQIDSLRLYSSTINSESEFQVYNGKIIRKIIVKRLEPFGTSVFDTSMKAESWIEKSINTIHIKTLENVITANLIFKKGDEINSYLLAENERVLRNLPYLYDARIYPVVIDSDFVDIYVICRDLWSIGLIPDIGSRAGNIEIYDLNYLGLGNAFKNQLFYDKDSSQNIGYRFEYDIRNIKKTFIDAGIFYQNVYESEKFGLFADRSFVTSSVKYAGGMSIIKTNDIAYVNSLQINHLKTDIKYFTSEIWFGKSIVLSRDKKNINSMRLILSAAYYSKLYQERLKVDINTNKIYHQSDLVLGSISLSKRNYYKGNLIYAFGTVEDIPHGYLIETTFGPEKREFSNRFYYGFQISAGDFISDFGYLYALLGIGGYKNGKTSEQDVIRLNINSFSNLFYYKRYKFRNFINLNYLIGINRFEGEYIKLDYTAPEMQSNLMLGTQKISLKMETVAFTPIDFYGFKVAFFGFWDLGILGSNKHFIFSEKYFLGLGSGLRIRNDNLVFQTFQFNISYYPLLPSGGSAFIFGISGQNILKLFDFISSKPKEVQFK